MPEVRFHVPTLLAPFTDGRRVFSVEAASVAEALQAAMEEFPLLRSHLQDEAGTQRRHVNVFYNDTEIRELGSLQMPARDGDEITIIQAVSGGSRVVRTP